MEEVNYTERLRDELLEILDAPQNREAAEAVREALKGRAVGRCETKTGWVSGKYIAFTCRFPENVPGEDAFLSIAEGYDPAYIRDDYYFICGLAPDTFHIHPRFFAMELEDGYFYLSFKLARKGLETG